MTLKPEDGTGLIDANSYASQAQADAYHDGRLHSLAWTAASPTVKDRALAMATTVLDATTRWQGARKTAGQALAWPRTGASFDGLEVTDAVPTPVVQATSELARLLIAEDLTQDVGQNDIQSLNLGKGAMEIAFRSGKEKKRIPAIVEELLQGLGTMAAAGGGITQRKVGR